MDNNKRRILKTEATLTVILQVAVNLFRYSHTIYHSSYSARFFVDIANAITLKTVFILTDFYVIYYAKF